MADTPSTPGNRVLARLSRPDFALLKPHLEPVALPRFVQLEAAQNPIDTIYFIDHGFASVVASQPGKREIEVGIIGREGLTGLPVVLGSDLARYTTYVQLAGAGHRISASNLRRVIGRSVSMHYSFLACVNAFLVQATETAIANGRSKNEERLARWLLMAHDRIDGDHLILTHRLLGIMLGAQRPNVTLAVQVLRREGLIEVRRGVISVLNRQGLVRFSNGAYIPTDSFKRT